jgi:excisionase family DNA binding protein
MMRPAEAGAVLRVHPRTVIRWAQAGKLADERTESGRHRFRRDEVLALAMKNASVPPYAMTAAVRAMIATCISLGLEREQAHVLMDVCWPSSSKEDDLT